MSFEVVQGNLLDSDAQYLCHQCNCVTNRAAHLAAAVFARFPYANIYQERSYPHAPTDANSDSPGHIVVRGDGQNQRFVINMLGQYYPGKPKFPDGSRDGFKARQSAFQQCLTRISQIIGLHSLAFPWMIGCGAAGGDWSTYLPLIEQFSDDVSAEVKIVRLN